ncbi:MAG TPA: HlyD family efflux transporter periplasmic adaptor subunit [Xanthobacteraceae bacterium]|nr:HlyD family efflux transporter periplasmic adaptor subunit [Xanthobacteraceae bacterium]
MVAPPSGNLPVPQPKPPAPRRRWRAWALALVLLAAATGGGGYYWWTELQSRLPPGIFYGNGRIEADEIDIDTKFAGRIAELFADEGSMVKAGQIVARMDTSDIQQSLEKSQAQLRQAQRALDEAHANLDQQQTQATLAAQEMDRTAQLLKDGWATKELYDQRRQTLDGANAGLAAARERVAEAEHALQAAQHDAEYYKVTIADNSLTAPRDGRIQYRIANVGEVLPAGGKVFTMLDISYVYMDIYLPTQEAGKVKFGDDARIVLDALPNVAIPAKVSFIATQAQFTPKTVETQSERDKLMFRIRVRIDPERLRARGEAVRSGLPGVAYVRTDPAVAWPPALQGKAAQ